MPFSSGQVSRTLVCLAIGIVVATPDVLLAGPSPTRAFERNVTQHSDIQLRVGAHAHWAVASTSSSSTAATAPWHGLGQVELVRFGESLDWIAKRSDRGEKAVEFRRLLLKAMAAPTQAEYRRIMRPFHARNKTHLGSKNGVVPDVTRTNAFEPDRLSTGPAAGVETTAEECSTEMFGVVYVDECATQEEVEEVYAEIDAMGAELSADQAEQLDLCSSKVQNPNDCYYTQDSELVSNFEGSGYDTSSESTALVDGEYAPQGCDASNSSLSASVRPPEECLEAAVLATGAFIIWVTDRSTFSRVGNILSRTGLRTGQGRILAIGFLAGFAIGSAINCWFM